MFRLRNRIVSWVLIVTMTACPSLVYAQQGAQPVDLSYVTPGAVVAAIAHPRRVLTSAEMELMPIEVMSAAGKKEVGIDPLHIEQVLAVVEPPMEDPPGFGLVFRLSQPYQADQIRLPPGMGGGAGLNLRMPNPTTLLVAPPEMLDRMLANQQNPQEGPLSRLLSRTSTDADFQIVGVVAPVRPMLSAMLEQAPLPPPLQDVKRLPDLIDAAKVEVSVVGQPRTSLQLLAASDNAAAELEPLLNNLLDMGQQMALAQIATNTGGDDPVEQAAAQYSQRVTKSVFDMLRPQRNGRMLRVEPKGAASPHVATIGILVALLLPAVQSARGAARRMQSTNNLKQIALAMHNYHNANRTFPARASFDAQGKPLLSWRVHLLPFLEQQALYEKFHLDEPWDSEHNKQFIVQMPAVYKNPTSTTSPGMANYLLPTGPGSIFEGQEGREIRQIRDGSSNTALAIEVNNELAAVWTKPDDLNYDVDQPLAGLGDAHPGGFNIAMADGSVRFFPATIDPQLFLRVLQFNDGQPVVLP